jgi:hypothetical protein
MESQFHTSSFPHFPKKHSPRRKKKKPFKSPTTISVTSKTNYIYSGTNLYENICLLCFVAVCQIQNLTFQARVHFWNRLKNFLFDTLSVTQSRSQILANTDQEITMFWTSASDIRLEGNQIGIPGGEKLLRNSTNES